METKVTESLSQDLKFNFNDKELQELLNRISKVKNEFTSLYSKKNQDEF